MTTSQPAIAPFADGGRFMPPFPQRIPGKPSSLQRLLLARRNVLAMWEEEAFELEFSEGRILSRMVYVCNSPRAVQFAFSHNHASFERKSAHMRYALAPLLGDGLFVSDGATWRQRRRIVQPIVHVSRLSRFTPVMVETALEMGERWRLSGGACIDALEESAHLTAEIISRTIFGRDLGHRHAAEIVEGFTDYQRAVGQVDVPSLLGLPDWFPRYRSPRLKRATARIHAVIGGIVDDLRNRKDRPEGSVIGELLDATDETGAPLSAEAIRNEAAVLFMAGHETTANTLAWAWFLLSQAPDVENKLHAELDGVLGGRPPQLEDVDRLVYARAVLEETMRLYPPVPILAREALTEERYDRFTIPKGSLVMVVPWLLHRHRKFWSSPDHFFPERFLPGSAEPVSKFAYVPFSIGPRICLGLSFGLVEAVLCLATLAQQLKLMLKPGHKVEPVCRLTLRPEGGLPMTIVPRLQAGSIVMPHAKTPAPTSGCPFHHG